MFGGIHADGLNLTRKSRRRAACNGDLVCSINEVTSEDRYTIQ